MILDYTHADWAATGTTWADTWQECIGYYMAYLRNVQNREPDILMLNAGLLNDAKASLASAQRFEITQNSDLTKLGHKSLTYEGLEIATEYGIPEAVGYFLNWDALELKSMQSQLVATETDFDVATSTDLIAMDCYCNLMIETPAWIGKLDAGP
jgi:hypothetical protein